MNTRKYHKNCKISGDMQHSTNDIEKMEGDRNDSNDIYKDLRTNVTLRNADRKRLCNALIGCSFGLAQDFNELEKILSEVADDKTM